MILYRVNRFAFIMGCGILAVLASACTASPEARGSIAGTNILYIYEDGSMKLNDRDIDPSNVVVYPDGVGGEKAALKMRVPLHPDYYRHTIAVERRDTTGANTAN